MSAQHTPGPRLEAGQLHESMRQRGCEGLFAVFEVSALSANVKHTVAENVPEPYALLFAQANNMLALLKEATARGPVGADEWAERARAAIAKAGGAS